MTGFTEVVLDDGTSILLEVFDPTAAAAAGGKASVHPDLPDGSGEVVAVGRLGNAARATAETLREALQPLGGVLDLMHGAVLSASRPPEQVEVEFGIKLSKDLSLGIVSAGGEAVLTVRATWRTGRALHSSPDGVAAPSVH